MKPLKSRGERLAAKEGQSPGTLVHIGERMTETVRISVIDYDENNFLEKEVAAVEDCFPFSGHGDGHLDQRRRGP